jgi:predicted nucleotidyltransferase
MQNLELLKKKLMQDSNILIALVFGSFAKGRQHQKSDLDIGLFFKQPLSGLHLLDYINELSEHTGNEVDLVVLNNASAFLKHQVMKNCIRLFIRDRVVYRRFREQTITDYDTYKFVSGIDTYDR